MEPLLTPQITSEKTKLTKFAFPPPQKILRHKIYTYVIKHRSLSRFLGNGRGPVLVLFCSLSLHVWFS